VREIRAYCPDTDKYDLSELYVARRD